MNYQGIIIEESLKDKSVLDQVKILKTEVEDVTEGHKTPWIKVWTMDTVEILEDQVDQVSELISKSLDKEHSSWYADFKNNQYHYVIFNNKIFKIDRSKPELYQEVTDYGVSIGIPSYQLDFSPTIDEWKRDKT